MAKVRAIITMTPDGQIATAIDNSQGLTYEDGAAALLALSGILGTAADVPISWGQVERHVHGPDEAHGHYHHDQNVYHSH